MGGAEGKAFMGGESDLYSLLMTISRAHEFEADQFGALYAYRAGFNPAHAVTLHPSGFDYIRLFDDNVSRLLETLKRAPRDRHAAVLLAMTTVCHCEPGSGDAPDRSAPRSVPPE